ncbi:hypothetical protein [Plesiomonas shigelloides]|uniref:DprA winged helix domain-containing protein n=1 Tax=Plesiomonas shigelloides 302-73 TaxID=1315976 RepID=R8ARH6_PLESH|nr:hypothetical protein [Plesiomonas shigelloides]AVQ88966.1 hypothetical protein C7R88_16795 [Plesiomonas shigelloides]EON88927.1 hypothetical protein PLESHI_08424 [Plesiomonas shigelloides 302-73]KAB7661751.1 hypothetical protein GBN25_14380 [Plesiomonas shigelloides]QIY07862.1 hypothetical protein FOC33_02270 [Plesiomonas shigelloides]QOH78617.1 hypothetical protein IHE26_09125 [Plesiomonas shigelloides]
MENHVDMTPQAKKIYNRLSCVRWTSPVDMQLITGMTAACCQLILTQLAMAGLVEDAMGEGRYFKRCRR